MNTKENNFIGIYNLEDKSLMDKIITFFENNNALHMPGVMGDQVVDKEKKDNSEIRIIPSDLEKDEYKIFNEYAQHLKTFFEHYVEEWPMIRTLGDFSMGAFQIQKYNINGHCSAWHSERTSLGVSHRVLGWMTYLNDIPTDGETEFLYQGLKVKPECGKTLFWPAEWTHTHRGNPTTKIEKYILTGWLNFK